jgi:hypothetical protein
MYITCIAFIARSSCVYRLGLQKFTWKCNWSCTYCCGNTTLRKLITTQVLGDCSRTTSRYHARVATERYARKCRHTGQAPVSVFQIRLLSPISSGLREETVLTTCRLRRHWNRSTRPPYLQMHGLSCGRPSFFLFFLPPTHEAEVDPCDVRAVSLDAKIASYHATNSFDLLFQHTSASI